MRDMPEQATPAGLAVGGGEPPPGPTAVEQQAEQQAEQLDGVEVPAPRKRRRRARAAAERVIETAGAWDGAVPLEGRSRPVLGAGAVGPAVVSAAPGSAPGTTGDGTPALSPRAARAARAQIARGITQVCGVCGGIAAARVGPEWAITEAECEALGTAWAACVPDSWLSGAQSPVWAAALITGGVLGPRAYVTWERRRALAAGRTQSGGTMSGVGP